MAVIDGVILKGRHLVIPEFFFLKKTGIRTTTPKPHGKRKKQIPWHRNQFIG